MELSKRDLVLGAAGIAGLAAAATPRRAQAFAVMSPANVVAVTHGWVTSNVERVSAAWASKGGWEKWLQTELDMEMQSNSYVDFERETDDPYGTRQTADFLLNVS